MAFEQIMMYQFYFQNCLKNFQIHLSAYLKLKNYIVGVRVILDIEHV